INDTITSNRANSQGDGSPSTRTGGGILVFAGAVALQNSIVAGNVAGPDPNPSPDDVSGTVTAHFSLIQTSTGTIFAEGSGDNLTGKDPLLAPLADNGGPTKTHNLLPGSPAHNGGSNDLAKAADGETPLSTDQRGTGFDRVRDGTVDIGAV